MKPCPDGGWEIHPGEVPPHVKLTPEPNFVAVHCDWCGVTSTMFWVAERRYEGSLQRLVKDHFHGWEYMGANERQVGGEHYKTEIQHWDFVLANNIPYMEAQIIKYVMRFRKKNGVQDLEKAKHFLEKLIEYELSKKNP